MKLAELKTRLGAHPDLNVRFHLPDGTPVPAHAHVTEVARIDKCFVDCGGTLRTDVHCRLQTWVADDLYHRLTAGKLLKILVKASSVLKSEDLEVDFEHEVGTTSLFPLESVEPVEGELVFRLATRKTACLAEDKCMRPPSMDSSILFKTIPTLISPKEHPAGSR